MCGTRVSSLEIVATYLQIWPVRRDLLVKLAGRPSKVLALLVCLDLVLSGPAGVLWVAPGDADVLLSCLNVQCLLVCKPCSAMAKSYLELHHYSPSLIVNPAL